MKRAERMVAMTQILMSQPNVLIPLSSFVERFGTAKSTISEDLLTIKESFKFSERGRLETVAGAAGGVRFIPQFSKGEAELFLEGLAERLSDKARILPGGFLYMTDILFDPSVLRPLGLIFADEFREKKPEVVVTIETKGIPIALMTAEALGLPLVIIRRGSRVTEGSSVGINYVSGSSKRIQTMSLPRRALEPGRKVILIDDFMKAGGTARGMMDLMAEFEAQVVGIGVLVEASALKEGKLVEQYYSLLSLRELDPETGKTSVQRQT